jgi:hypothetical protein
MLQTPWCRDAQYATATATATAAYSSRIIGMHGVLERPRVFGQRVWLQDRSAASIGRSNLQEALYVLYNDDQCKQYGSLMALVLTLATGIHALTVFSVFFITLSLFPGVTFMITSTMISESSGWFPIIMVVWK